MFKAEHPDFDYPSSYAVGNFEDPITRKYETTPGVTANLLKNKPHSYHLKNEAFLAPSHYSRNVGVGKSHPP